ncbi:hypothetical protein Pla133_07590 [Planctomycetes bacterium Pla133]|uniref:Uncharacterized protein n=1 Tax=Engelhardtia mirabilis TaxID=2528011 RepID=A0A518BFD9_9BACT|nr:hypothetical protein Pla133_07590 [Planctomycetes bacterium Pla133]
MERRHIAWFALVAGGFASAAFVFAVGPYAELAQRLGTERPFDEAPATSVAGAKARLAAMDAATVELYANHLRWDLVAMVANGALLAGLLLALAPSRLRARSYLLALPALVMLADAVENSVLSTWLANLQTAPSETSVLVARTATTAKFGAFAVAVLAIAALAAARMLHRRRGRSPRPGGQSARVGSEIDSDLRVSPFGAGARPSLESSEGSRRAR